MSKIEEAMQSVNEALVRLPSAEDFLSDLENTIDVFNTLLYKGNMITTEGSNFGKLLLQHEQFIAMRLAVDQFITAAYEENLVKTPEFDAKVAEFWSNWNYALLISSASPEKELLSQFVLYDYNRAINHILTSERVKITGIRVNGETTIRPPDVYYPNDDYVFIVSEETAKIFSNVLIPLLHLRGRIFSGAYNSTLRNDEAFHDDVERIKKLDAACIEALNRSPHISLAILERAPLQNTARDSNNLEELEACLHLIEVYNAQYQSVYREDGRVKDWATDPFNLSVTAEIKGRCLLKLGRFEEAYHAFEDMRRYDEDAGRLVRAGWAEFFMAKAAKNLLIPGGLISYVHILYLLESAELKESTSLTRTWARDEIKNEMEEFNQLFMKKTQEAETVQLESMLNRPGKAMVTGFESMAYTPISVAVLPPQVEGPDVEAPDDENTSIKLLAGRY